MPQDFRFIAVREERGIVTLEISRPEVLNALHPAAHSELAALFDEYAARAELRVAIITGSGDRAFCVGNDLKARAASGGDDFPPTGFAGITKRFDLWKPVIAAVNGLCLGGGLEIVAASDIAIAAESAEFGLPEPLVGAAATGGGGLQRLVRQIGMKDAMWLALRGRRIVAKEALRIGLINEVVPLPELAARVRQIAEEILACAPLAVEASKQVMLQSLAETDIAAAIGRFYPALERMMRRPRWIGG
jgi:enoyl-CoA hydratase/carnithine racemase